MLYPAVAHSLRQYEPGRVRELVSSTKTVGKALKTRLGSRVRETPVIIQLEADSILAEACEREGISAPGIVAYEATAAVAMLLLREYGAITVHFAGLPPGTSALLIKFLPPETVEEFGGATAIASAIDDCISKLAELLHNPGAVRALLLGDSSQTDQQSSSKQPSDAAAIV